MPRLKEVNGELIKVTDFGLEINLTEIDRIVPNEKSLVEHNLALVSEFTGIAIPTLIGLLRHNFKPRFEERHARRG